MEPAGRVSRRLSRWLGLRSKRGCIKSVKISADGSCVTNVAEWSAEAVRAREGAGDAEPSRK